MSVRPTDEEREAIVAVLQRHFVDDRLTLEQYTERVGDVWEADDRHALDAVLTDLPPLPTTPVDAGRRRHGEGAVPSVTWRPSRERFRDPTTGRIMRVWVDVVDGTRHYVAEG